MGIILFAVLVIVMVIFGHQAAAKRRKALAAWAAENGLSFSEEKDRGVDDRFAEFDCFRQGSNRYGQNVMAGRINGRDVMCFDYHYETQSTDSKGNTQTDDHDLSAAVVFSQFPLKKLRIRPENFLDKVAEFFGADDIDFESAEFSRKFHVKSPDRKWAFDVIHARAMEFLLSRPRFTIEFGRRCVLVTESERLFDAARFAGALEAACGLLDLLPPYVVRQQQES